MARVIVNIVKHNNYEMFASDTPRVVGQKENENGTNLRQNKFLTFTALDACHLVKSATASEITGVKQKKVYHCKVMHHEILSNSSLKN